jgi:YbbR domain-containing protein
MSLRETRIPALIVSLLFALLLWGSVNLTYEYQASIEIPLELRNINPDRSLAIPIPQTVMLRVRGTGWLLARLHLFPEMRYVIDLTGIDQRKRLITLPDFPERVNLPSGIRILRILPETLTIHLDSKVTRSVPLRADGDLTFRQGYDLVGPIQLNPDRVDLVGASSLVNSIEVWKTKRFVLRDLKASTEITAEVDDSLAYSISASPSSAVVHLDVQPIAEKTFKGIPVEVNQVPSGRRVVLLPPKIDIIIRGGVDKIGPLQLSDFKAYVDYRSILLDTTGSIQPSISGPGYVKIVSREPYSLQYVVRK